MDRDSTVLLCIFIYMGMCLCVGFWAMRRTKSSKDFFMAGRSLGFIVTALAVFSANMSGLGFVGGPGLVYKMGMSSIWICLTAPLGFAMAFFLVGKRIRLLAELRDSLSLPDTVAARYKNQLTGFLTCLAILLGVMGYLATQILAMATVLQDILSRNGIFGEVSLEMCVFSSTAERQTMPVRYKQMVTAPLHTLIAACSKETLPGTMVMYVSSRIDNSTKSLFRTASLPTTSLIVIIRQTG